MKSLKWTLIIIVVLALPMLFVGMPYMTKQTKKHSPEKTAAYTEKGMNLSVTYSSPSKNGRVIFGELIPYGHIWRTGANEPTTFTTATDIKIIDKNLAAGTYSLWTRPEKDSWSIIFNSEVPEWGVTIMSGGKETTRNPEYDVVEVEVASNSLSAPQENFTISFEDAGQLNLSLSWDETVVMVPINK